MHYDKDLKNTNKIMKGGLLAATLYACTAMTYREGGALNPAFAAA
jgi:hypothetical protein